MGWSGVTVGRVTVVICVAGLVTAATITPASSTDPVTMSFAGPEDIAPGESVMVEVRVSTTIPIYGVEFTIEVMPDVVNITTLRKGEFLSRNASSIVLVNDVSDDQAEYVETRTGVEEGITGSGTVATLNVSVPDAIDATEITVSYVNATAADPNATELNTSSVALSIPVEDGSKTSTEAETNTGSSPGEESETGGNGDDDSDSDGDSRTSTDSTGSTSEGSMWRTKVDGSVFDRLEANGRASVIVVVRTDASLERIAELANETGARDVEVFQDIGAISATVSGTTLRMLAEDSGVDRIRIDTRERKGTSVVTSVPTNRTAKRETTATVIEGATETTGTVGVITKTTPIARPEQPGLGIWSATLSVLAFVGLRVYRDRRSDQ